MAIHALIITSRSDEFHDYEAYARQLVTILAQQAQVLDIVDDLAVLQQAEKLATYDVLIFCGHFAGRDEAAERTLEQFVHTGHGLVVIHIASSSFEFSPRWRKLVGRVWEYGGPYPFTSSHPEPGPFQIDITDPHHPATMGLGSFLLEMDERYQDLLVAPNAKTHDLAMATLAGRTEPMVWVLTPPEGGRVFHVTPGHSLSTYQNSDFQRLLQRGFTWAAG